MSTGTWGDVVAWATAEIEAGRTKLETANGADAPAIQARIAVMRELQNIKDTPTPAAIPAPVPYA